MFMRNEKKFFISSLPLFNDVIAASCFRFS